jgi:dihydrofolate reductase
MRVVFSQTLKEVPTNTKLISHDFVNQVTQLKRQASSDILLLCGSELVAELIELNLIDEIKLILSPKIYGKGHYLFGKLHKSINLKLIDLKKFSSGGILHHYKVNYK